MDDALQSVMELSRDPVLALENGMIAYMNSAAQKAFPGFRVGGSAAELLPDPRWLETAECFVSGVVIASVRYTVSALRRGGMLFLTFEPDLPVSESRSDLSESVMNGMLSSLFNIGMASSRLRSTLPEKADDAKKYLALLDHSYYSLLHLLRNQNMLLSLSRGSMELSYCRVDLAALCSDIVSSTDILTRGKYAKIVYSCEKETMPARMDAAKVELLVLDLLVNSLQNTPKEGQILLRLAQSGENMLISVSDTGSGIPSAQLKSAFNGLPDRIGFDAFRFDPGSRIGLPLCRLIAEKHGGTLIVESREGQGTDIRVLLPLSPSDTMNLMSQPQEYINGGMDLILTELSGLLGADAYADYVRE